MSKFTNPQSHSVARNTGWNIVGQVIPLGIGFVTTPYIVRELGPERFGILSIAWLLLGYFSLFDLGLGRATTKFLAESLNQKSEHASTLFWTSILVQLGVSVIGGVLLCAAVPFAVTSWIKIPASLLHEAQISFLLLGGSLPVVIGSNAVRGALEAGQRFDLVNYVKVPANVSVFLLPAIALYFGFGLPAIVFLLVLARAGAAAAYFGCSMSALSVLRGKWRFDRSLVRPLLIYGGWLTAANIVNPILSYSDRFLIGGMLSVTWLGYYTVPSEMLSRMAVLPASLMLAAFPAFAAIASSGDRIALGKLYRQTMKWILAIMIPVTLVLVVFAGKILTLWLSPDFATKTTFVFQALSITYLINALDMVPGTFLQAIGHANIPAKVSLIQAPIYLFVLWLMVHRFGIEGAAVATTLRIVLECGLLLIFAWKISSRTGVEATTTSVASLRNESAVAK